MEDGCTSWYQLPLEYAPNISVEDITCTNDSDSIIKQCVRYEANIKLSTSDERGEEVHTIDSLALLLTCWLLGMTVITIWIFKSKRLRIFHETGLSLIYGKIDDQYTM